ncbi:hypothetical protein, partial [Agrococcus casei]|uniref:hypothetical protein n=1 Tax=Agrococcus casei TaxID=343512 RepID=UPI003F8EA346
ILRVAGKPNSTSASAEMLAVGKHLGRNAAKTSTSAGWAPADENGCAEQRMRGLSQQAGQ